MLDKLKALVKSAFGNDSEESVRMFVKWDLGTTLAELKVSITETRTTSVRYNTNSYWALIGFDTSSISNMINESLGDDIPLEELAPKYFDLKSKLASFLKWKYDSAESYLKRLLREAQRKDGIEAINNE